jgi:hypothetical protein
MIQATAPQTGQEDAPVTGAEEPVLPGPTPDLSQKGNESKPAPIAETEAPPADDQPLEKAAVEQTPSEEPGGTEDESTAPDKVQKRIDKLTAQKAELKTQLDAIQAKSADTETKLTEAQQQIEELRRTPARSDPTERELQTEIQVLQGQLEGLDDLRAGAMDEAAAARFKATLKPYGVLNESGEFVYDQLREYRALCREGIAQRTEQLGKARERRKADAQAAAALEPIIAKEFPWTKEKTSQEYIAWQKLQRDFPDALNHPTGKAVMAVVAQHWPAFVAKLNAANGQPNGATPKHPNTQTPRQPVKPAPKVPGVPGVTPAMRTDNRAQAEQLKAEALKNNRPGPERQAYIRSQIQIPRAA